MAVLKSEWAAFVCTHSLLAPQGFLHALPETDECTKRGSRPNPEPLEEPLQQHSFSNVSNVKKMSFPWLDCQHLCEQSQAELVVSHCPRLSLSYSMPTS